MKVDPERAGGNTMHQTQQPWPSYIIYKDQSLVLETVHAQGSISCLSIEAECLTEAGKVVVSGLQPSSFTRLSISDEAERLRRQSPLLMVRELQQRAIQTGLHLFAALSYEAAHIFDDLPLPQQPFCHFIVASAKTLTKAEWIQLLESHQGSAEMEQPSFRLLDDTSPSFSDHFKQAREHLRMGDIFEIVLSRRFVLDNPHGQAFPYLARSVASLQAPYRFALRFPDTALVGASPELLVHVDGRRVTNRPISGSMRRQSALPELTKKESNELKKLYGSEKEKSELDMLIDLARHDLHRVCSAVEVSHYREALILESVVHTQATVTGTLKPGFDPLDACFSCLNAGTLVGAPKKKAMEIIRSLEGIPRRFYGGNLIHCDPDGNLKSTILIRTFQIDAHQVTLQAGATVLYDSSEEYEFWECGAKAQKLLDLVGLKNKAWGVGSPPPIDERASPEMHAHQILGSYADAGSSRARASSLRALLIDNHDSFTFNLATLFEHLGCTVTVVRNDAPLPPRSSYDVLILSPGPSAPRNAGSLIEICQAHDGNTPIFGVCLGFQALVEARGGELGVMNYPLHGKARFILRRDVPDAALLSGLPEPFAAARYHSLYGKVMPDTFQIICVDSEGRPMGLSDLRENRPPICAVQFHPESFLSGTHGIVIARNWLTCAEQWCKQSKQSNRSRADAEAQALVKAILQDEPSEGFLNSSLLGLNGSVLARVVRHLRTTATTPPGLSAVLEAALEGGHVFEVCGTGGTKSHRLNTSTLTALFSTSVGLRTVKHGGRSASGHKGSLDLLEHFGLDLKHLYDTSPESLRTVGLAFLGAALTYAPFGRYAATRKSFGKPSLFNLLGPLLSPARPSQRILGCYGPDVFLLLADTLCELGEDGVVLFAEDREGIIDEVNPLGVTHLAKVSDGKVSFHTLPPFQLRETALGRHLQATAQGTDVVPTRTTLFQDGLTTASELVGGSENSPQAALAQDFVFANLALMIVLDRGSEITAENVRQVFSRLNSLSSSLCQSAQATINLLKKTQLDDLRSPLAGKHQSWMDPVSHQQRKPATAGAAVAADASLKLSARARALLADHLLVAEVKERTPQLRFQSRLPLGDRIAAYTQAASAISVVTHPHFDGSLDLLRAVRTLTERPLLAKDFIQTTPEIDLLADAGADGVLLLADWLTPNQIDALAMHCLERGVLPVIESTVRDPASCGQVDSCFLPLLNARNLFSLQVGSRFRQKIAARSSGSVWASDVSTPLEARLVMAQNKGVLIGEALMRLNSIQEIHTFLQECLKKSPLLKACGAQTADECIGAAEAGADLVGINLIPNSRRHVATSDLHRLLEHIHAAGALDRVCLLTADTSDDRLIEVLSCIDDDALKLLSEQPYGIALLPLICRKEDRDRCRQILPATPLLQNLKHSSVSYGARLLVIDGDRPGSGQTTTYLPCPADLKNVPVLVAGGITAANAQEQMERAQNLGWNVVGVDVATGVAQPSGVGMDLQRVECLRKQLL